VPIRKELFDRHQTIKINSTVRNFIVQLHYKPNLATTMLVMAYNPNERFLKWIFLSVWLMQQLKMMLRDMFI